MKIFDLILGGITAFIIAGGGVIASVLFGGYDLNQKTWIAAGVVGAIVGARDIRSSMKLPPLSNGNIQALKQLYASQPTPPIGNSPTTPPITKT